MISQTFINLSVDNVKRSMNFFSQLGFSFNPQFTDQNASCMILSDNSFAMLLDKNFFKTFTSKEVVNSHNATESIIALALQTRAEVDDMIATALKAGGAHYKDPDDRDGMYGGGFQDPDGHLWEVFFMG